MIRRAAIIPGSWTALVIADEPEGGVPLVPLVAESFQVGELVPAESGTKPLQRVLSATDVDRAVARLVRRLVDLQVSTVAIELATAKGSHWPRLSSALQLACAESGIATTYVRRWRIWKADEHRAWMARRIVEGYQGWLEGDGAYEVTKNCAVMLLESLTSDRPEQVPAQPKEVAHVPLRESCNAPIADASPGETRGERIESESSHLEAPGVRASGASLGGSRVAGIDPGSGYLGLVIAEGNAAPLRLVLKTTLPVGQRVPLAKPRKIKRGGETITLTTRHSLTEPMVDALADRVVSLLLEHGVTRLALEHVESVHLDGSQMAAASSIATALIRSQWIEAVIGDRAKKAGIEVVRVSASTWRAIVAGRRKRGGAGAELIPQAVERGFERWPPDSDVHERDAGGLCLWLVAPPPTPAPPPRPPRPKGDGTRKRPGYDGEAPKPPSYHVRLERLRKETEAKRAASGCTCANIRRGRHGAGCPLGHKNGELAKQKAQTKASQERTT